MTFKQESPQFGSGIGGSRFRDDQISAAAPALTKYNGYGMIGVRDRVSMKRAKCHFSCHEFFLWF